MYQKLIFVGRLGADVEMRFTPNGQAVANFSVATDRIYKNATGEQVRVTTWFRVSVWGKQAESCNQYLTKGSMVLIEGTLNPDKETGRPRIWESNGKTGANYEVNAEVVRFLSAQKTDSKELLQETLNENDIPF